MAGWRGRNAGSGSDTNLPEPERLAHRAGDAEVLLYRWAKPGAPRLLLVHGIGMGHRTFDRFAEAMLPHAEIISVDLPGFGDSPEPDTAGSMADTAAVLAAAVDAICALEASAAEAHRPFIAVGHSMGAQVVTELALARPDLVERVVLIGPAVNVAERSVGRQMVRMLQDLAEGKPLHVVVRGVIDYFNTGVRWFAKKLAPTLTHPIENQLPRLRQPGLVLVGSHDRVTPAEWCLKLAHRLRESEFRVVDGPGHEAMLADSERMAELVRRWAF